ncbi:MAG: hypothetical protein ACRD1S_01760, partial [Vicinamibacterales bacterium]
AEARVSRADTGDPVRWSRQLIWGSHEAFGGVLMAEANAWEPGLIWGASRTPSGDAVVWGTLCASVEAPCSASPWTLENANGRSDARRIDPPVLPIVRNGWPVDPGRFQ